jgi:Zn-finger domain-containing protein
MFIGNNYSDCTGYNRLEMKDVNKDILPWLEDIIEENNGRIEQKEWKSKYNSYVVYDYEPFCTEGFQINIVISSNVPEYLSFIKYLYDEKMNTIEYLNSCITI